MTLAIVLGTRPEIIKFSPLIRLFQSRGIDFIIVHTNQHYTYEMDAIFFSELELPQADVNLEIMSGTHAEQTGKMLQNLELFYVEQVPDIVLVEGDTNTVLAGALAAVKMHIPVGHVEAGLRCGDRWMPEEINRVLCDHISELLFAPTEVSVENLLKEGIDGKRIYKVGNTIVDATLNNIKLAVKKSKILKELELSEKQYLLVTFHRQENVDDEKQLKQFINVLRRLSTELDFPVIFPAHPRTVRRLEEFELLVVLKSIKGVKLIDPIGYLDFLVLEYNAYAVLTDSGGIQEECCILKTPCLTLRENTERPETVTVGANQIVGLNADAILDGLKKYENGTGEWKNPFGDGNASKRILDIIKDSGLI